MKKNMKHRVLSVLSAVLCVLAMTLSVSVLPGLAYAKITKNPLFAAVLAAAAENDKSKDAGKDAGKAGKEKGKEKTNSEGNGVANGEAGKGETNREGTVGNKGTVKNPNGGSVYNGNAGKDAGDEKKQSNVPANVPEHKSNKENGKQVDKNKKNTEAKNEDAKEKAKKKTEEKAKSKKEKEKAKKEKAKKTKGQDRDADTLEKLNLDQVKKLPACVAKINEDNTKVTITSPSGEDKCAISAERSEAFDAIREEIKNLSADGSEIDFVDGVKAYGYGSLSKDKEGLFSGENISSIGNDDRFDVSNVTDMSYLFKDSSLTDFSFLSEWDVSKVTNMESMFEGCAGLSDISGLANWKVDNVTNMSGMFSGCARRIYDDDGKITGVTGLTDISALSNWNVGNVRNMSGMFASVIKDQDKHDALNPVEGYASEMAITSVEPLSKWNVSKVMNMNRMFEGCTEIKDFDGLKEWNTKSVSAMSGMFEYCKSMSSLKFLEKWNVKNVEYMMVMFALCGNIESTEGLGNWGVSNVKKMDGMFAYCSKLNSISGLSNWNKTGKSSTDQLASTFRMFYGCSFLTSLQPLRGWNVGSVENMSSMFDGCGSLTSLEPLEKWNVDNVTKMSSMFSSCNSLTSLQPLSGWNVGSVTDMSSMFNGCNGLTSLQPLSGWNVGSVTKMSSMFSGCHSLSNLKGLEKWNVGSVENMGSMFSDCYFEHTNKKGDVVKITGLTDISALSGWNVGSVTNMFNMFSGCTRLGNLKGLEGWNVSNVTNMSSMFSDCKKLTGAADLSKWDISKVTDFTLMFSNAGAESGDSLILDFSNKNFTKPTNSESTTVSVDGMFGGFKGTLIANGWESQGFDDHPDDDPIKSNFATGGIFSLDENYHSNNIVVTNNVTILDTISNDDDFKNIAYYIPVKAKLMEPGDIKNDNMTCDCNIDSGGTTYTYYVPALYNSSNLEKEQDEKSQDYAYRIVKNSFASKFRSAIDDSQSGEVTGGEEDSNSGLRSARLKSRVKELRYARKSRSVRDSEGEGEEVPESPEEGQGNTYKIMFKKPSEGGCTWTELGEGEGGAVPVSNPKSPLVFFTTMYYLETFVQPVPLPHTGGQSAVMFTFLSIGLFSMFAVAGAFGRHGWVASVLPSTALAGFAKVFSGGALDVASGAKHCFAHSVAHSVVSGSMLKTAVSAAIGFFARFRGDGSTFCKHAKQL
ncbi:BspA family leucine-rich repeat surface protein [Gardnerella vaginalis]|uniref:BspA family leucine-rich repeat surface protein n=1 Tax=Gardnerella vaginalis TaxID=2702 RepID=UPI0039EE02AE